MDRSRTDIKTSTSTSSNSILPTYQQGKPAARSPLSKPRRTWPKNNIVRCNLIAHLVALLLAVPTLALFAVDLHAYTSQPHPTPYSTTHPTRYFSCNPIEIVDGIALAALAVTIIHSTVYLICFHQSVQPITPTTIQKYVVLLFLAKVLLGATVLGVSCTAIAMRSYTSNCYRFLYLDGGACSSHRRGMMRAAGAMGVFVSVAIQIRWPV